jgi:hypothetical protein
VRGAHGGGLNGHFSEKKTYKLKDIYFSLTC